MNQIAFAMERSRAGLVSRVTADLIDAVIVCLGAALIAVGTSMLGALFAGSRFSFPRLQSAMTVSGLSIVYFAYLTFFWTATGRTPGKQVSGLGVVTSRGEPLGILRAAGRAILCIAFPIGLLWVLVSSRNRAVHDVLLGTAVIYDWHVHRPAARSTKPAPS